MATAGGGSAGRVPGYLGRILDSGDEPVGTCFQVAPGVLVTAWHVIDDVGAAKSGTRVQVDPLAGGEPFGAVVARTDSLHDLAILTAGRRLHAVAGPLTPPTGRSADSKPPGACAKRPRNWRPPRLRPPARPEPRGSRSARATDSPSKVPSNASGRFATRSRLLPRQREPRRPSRWPDPQAPHPPAVIGSGARPGGCWWRGACRFRRGRPGRRAGLR